MDQSPSMTNLKPSPQNTAGWSTSQNPSFANKMDQMRECDICGMPEHPPNDHPFLPRMPNDPMAMTQPQMPMPPLPMQPPPMQTNPAQTQAPPGQNEGGMGSGRIPTGGGGAMQPSSGGGGGSGGGGADGGYGSMGHGMGGAGGGGMRPQPGPVVSFETDYVSDTPAQNRMQESIYKQILDKKVGCGCRKTFTNKKFV